MCDYCDCRSEPEIAALSAEHDRLLSILFQMRGAVASEDLDLLGRTAAELQSQLDRHAAREEQGLFAQLRAEVGDAYVEAFAADHDRIHALVAAAAAGDVGAVGYLDRVLRDHILLEESDLFPAAHQLLSPAQWDAVPARRTPRKEKEVSPEMTTATTVTEPLRAEHRAVRLGDHLRP